MTKELAIRIITGDVLGTSEQTQEAVTMAVKALSMSEVPDKNVGDTISRQAAIDSIQYAGKIGKQTCISILKRLPSAQPEITHCNSCKHWTQSTGKMKGYGLGRCDFHDADLVTCNGFCYWAERRNDE